MQKRNNIGKSTLVVIGTTVITLVVTIVFSTIVKAQEMEDEKQPKSILKQLEYLEKENIALKKEILALLQKQQTQLDKLQETVERGNPWETHSANIREIVIAMLKDTSQNKLHEYEYGIYRNGGFRILVTSTWNGGWRVMTEPYMIGDSQAGGTLGEPFGLGGSMWIWDTHDPKDDRGKDPDGNERIFEQDDVYHYYYRYSNGKVTAFGGNGIRKPHEVITNSLGDSIVYRRKRK